MPVVRLNIFVACPYTLFPLDDYKRTFSTVERSYDVKFKFADEHITNQHILAKITNYIRDHDFSLFDITGWNAKVSLELGIAVGSGKRYFILRNSKADASRDVPSDIRGIDRIQYASNSELEAKLILLIKQEIPQQPGRSDSAFETVKGQVLNTLRTSPGLNIGRLADTIGEDKSLLQSTVRALVLAGELKTKGRRKGTTYFTKDHDLRTAPGPRVNLVTKQRIIQAVRSSPGMNLSEISVSVDAAKAAIQPLVHELVDSGKLKKRGERRGTKYFSHDTDLRKVRSLL